MIPALPRTARTGGSSAAIQARLHEPAANDERYVSLSFDKSGNLIEGAALYRILPDTYATAALDPTTNYTVGIKHILGNGEFTGTDNTLTDVGTASLYVSATITSGTTSMPCQMTATANPDGEFDANVSLSLSGNGFDGKLKPADWGQPENSPGNKVQTESQKLLVIAKVENSQWALWTSRRLHPKLAP